MSEELPVEQQLEVLNQMFNDVKPQTETQEISSVPTVNNEFEPNIKFKVDEEKIFFLFKPLLARYNSEIAIVRKSIAKVDGKIQRLKNKISKIDSKIERLQGQNEKLKIMLSDKSPLASFLALSIKSNEEKIERLKRNKKNYNKQKSAKSKKSQKLNTKLEKLQYKLTKFYCLSNVILSLYSKENRNQLYYDSMMTLNDMKKQRCSEREKNILEKIQTVSKALDKPNLYADEKFRLNEKLNKLNTKLNNNSDKMKHCDDLFESLQKYKAQSIHVQNKIIDTVKEKVEEEIKDAIIENTQNNEELLNNTEEIIENSTVESTAIENTVTETAKEQPKQAEKSVIKKEETALLQEKFDTLINGWQNNISNLVDLIRFKTHFPKYSLRNTALIFSQMQGAISVNSQSWWSINGHSIRTEAKPIEIFVPVMDKFLVLEDGKRIPFDEASDELKLAAQQNGADIKIEEKLNHYEKGDVYDISQTTCPIDQYPKPYKATDLATNEKLEKVMEFAKEIGIKCVQQDMGDNNNCKWQSDQSTLYINSKLDDAEKLSKLIFGVSYATMWQKDMSNSPASMFQTEVLSIMISDVCGIAITNEQIKRLSDKYNAFLAANSKLEKPLVIGKVLEDTFSKYKNMSYKLTETLKKSVEKKQNNAVHL